MNTYEYLADITSHSTHT